MFPADVARASTVRFNGYKACQQTDTSKLFTVVTEKQNGDVQWMYESMDIIAYLDNRFNELSK